MLCYNILQLYCNYDRLCVFVGFHCGNLVIMHGMEHAKCKFVVILIRETEHRTDRGKDVMY